MDHKTRRITLWKGSSAGVRLKFIGSRASGDTRKRVGFHYKTEVLDEGDESKTFRERVLGMAPGEEPKKVVSSVSSSEPSEHKSAAQLAAEQGITVSDEELERIKSGPGGKFGKMGGLGARPQKTLLATDFAETAPTTPSPTIPVKKVKEKTLQELHEEMKKEAKEILRELGTPKGYSMEMIVIGNRVYRIVGDDRNIEFEDLDNPLDGIIMIKEYTPQLICENGNIKAIELLKRTSEDVEEEEFTQDLADLTAMFQIEIE